MDKRIKKRKIIYKKTPTLLNKVQEYGICVLNILQLKPISQTGHRMEM